MSSNEQLPAAQSMDWPALYRRRVLFVDAAVLFGSFALAQVIRFGFAHTTAGTTYTVSYPVLGLVIAVVWWAALQLDGATRKSILGDGVAEYRRVIHASVMTFGLVAIVSLLFKQDLSRGYLAAAFPLGAFGLLAGRKYLRRWLAKERLKGALTTNVLVVGSPRTATNIDKHFRKHKTAGFRVTGVWVPDRMQGPRKFLGSPERFVPIIDNARSIRDALAIADASMVIVSDTEHIGHEALKDLTWDLHLDGVELMVSPNVVDIASPRIQLRPVGDMPFLHLEQPTYEGTERMSKIIFDKLFSVAALVAASPVLLAAALAVKFTSEGPILYRSERIGVNGEPFEMLKFRTMVVNADELKAQLASDQNGVLFKMKNDPRITKVGAFLRRFSIDELPQLINVLKGDMSIVGPRPPLREEVEQYSVGVERRLLVKQGITGPWQVSGRSNLSWDDTVRLDIDYVENWSMLRDLQIVWRTVQAVLARDGAY